MYKLLFIFLFLNLQLFSQTSGDLDFSFGNQGKVIIDYSDIDYCEDVVIDDSNNIYFAGYTTTFGSTTNTDFIVGKLKPSGLIDSSFSNNGFYVGDFPKVNTSSIKKIELLNDGMLFFGTGLKYGVADTQFIYVQKVFFNGVIDTTFGDSGTYSGAFLSTYNYPGSIAVQSDGKILVCGAAYDSLTMQDIPLLGRLLPNGTPDTTFSSSGFKCWDMSGSLQDANNLFYDIPEHNAGGFLNDVLVLANGNYFFSGYYYSGTSYHCLAMMVDQEGNFVSTFASGGYLLFQNSPGNANYILKAVKYDDQIALAVQIDGNFVVYDYIVQTIDTFGVLNNVYAVDFNNQKDVIKDILAVDGELLLAGYSTLTANIQPNYASDYFGLAKYNGLGVLDNQFANNGLFLENFNTSDESGSTSIYSKNSKMAIGGYLNNISGTNITDIGIMLIYNSTITSIAKNHEDIDLAVFPNPTKDKLTINSSEKVSKINLFTVTGKEVEINPKGNFYTASINVSDLSRGIYILEIETEEGKQLTKKIVLN